MLEAELGDELVALEPHEGACFGFNEVAASIWRLLETPKSFDQIREGLLDLYDVSIEQCTDDLAVFLAEMVADGLIIGERNASAD